MSKQDRQGARTLAGLEQKYNFGRVFSDQEKENARQNKEMNRQEMTMAEFISFATFEIDRLTIELSNANSQIAALQAADVSFEGRMTGAEKSIQNHDGRLQTTAKSLRDHGVRLLSAEGSIENQNTRLSAAEGRISGQEGRLTVAESGISSLEERVTALETTSTA